ncbi:hypothetical protein V8F06_009229, partial [Rhypophila decipiens]
MRPRLAPKRISNPPPQQWVEPANYRNNDPMLFMRGEVALCHLAETAVKVQRGGTSTFAAKWGNGVESMAIESLHGCVGVIVVSQRGALMFHIWEVPSFIRYDSKTGQLLPRDENAWPMHVYWPLRYINYNMQESSMAGILNLRTDSQNFQESDNLPDDDEDWHYVLNNDVGPVVYLVSPVTLSKQTDEVAQQLPYRYPTLVNQVEQDIRDIFADQPNPYPNIPIYPLRYSPPAQEMDANYATPGGKVLLQYQPAPDCQGQAQWRMWVEGKPIPGTS